MIEETSCRKTSLIRKLSELMNNGERKMKIMNIKAGINNNNIINI